MRKKISLVLVFFLFFTSLNLMAKEKLGLLLVIQKTENQGKRGELIAEKQKALLPFDEIRAVPIEELKEIKHNLKPQNETRLVSGIILYALTWIWTNSLIF